MKWSLACSLSAYCYIISRRVDLLRYLRSWLGKSLHVGWTCFLLKVLRCSSFFISKRVLHGILICFKTECYSLINKCFRGREGRLWWLSLSFKFFVSRPVSDIRIGGAWWILIRALQGPFLSGAPSRNFPFLGSNPRHLVKGGGISIIPPQPMLVI